MSWSLTILFCVLKLWKFSAASFWLMQFWQVLQFQWLILPSVKVSSFVMAGSSFMDHQFFALNTSFWLRQELKKSQCASICLSIRPCGPSLSKASSFHMYTPDSLRRHQDDFRMTNPSLSRAFNLLLLGCLWVLPQKWYSLCGSTPKQLKNRHWEYSY